MPLPLPASIRMVISFSPWRKAEGDGFELGPKRRWRHSEAYLRRLAERRQASVWPDLWPPRHAARQTSRSKVFAVALSRRGNTGHLFAPLCVASLEKVLWGSCVAWFALDNSALFGDGIGPPAFAHHPGAAGRLPSRWWRPSLVMGSIMFRGAFRKTASAWAASWPGALPPWCSSPPWWRARSLRIAARFTHGTVSEALFRKEVLGRKLVWGFCASYGVYLLSVFLPNVIQPSAGATMMVLFGGRRGAGDGGCRLRR